MKNFLLLLFMIITTMVDAQTVLKPTSLIIGKGSDVDMTYVVDRAGANDPKLKWDGLTFKWSFSNDGLTFGEMVDKSYVDTGLALKAPLASPAFTGVPTAPTATPLTNTTQVATTAYVDAAVTSSTAPDATTSSKGIVQLAGDLAGTATAPTVPGLALKAPLASPVLTGVPEAPTASPGTNTTQIATTAYVATAVTAATDPTKISGPASATDNAITRYDGTTGKLAQNSSATIDDSGNLAANTVALSATSNQITSTSTSNLDLTTADSTATINAKRKMLFQGKKLHTAYNDPTSGSSVTLEDHTTSFVRLTASANLVSINGIPAGTTGDQRIIVNLTGASVTINNDTGATAGNRILTGTGANIKIKNNGSIQVQYDVTQSRWFIIGGVGGSSGITDTDVMFVQDFEGAVPADFATLTGWSLNTSSPLHGDVDMKVTHATATTTYTIKQGSITVAPKYREKNLTIKVTAKSSATAGNLVMDAGCTTDTDLLNSESLDFSSLTGGNEAFASFDVPSTCTALSYTVRALPETGPPTSSIDDVSIYITGIDDVSSALVQELDYELSAGGNAGQTLTSGVTKIPFIPISTNGAAGTWNGDTFTALEDGVYNFKLNAYFTAVASRSIDIIINGNSKRIGEASSNSYHEGSSSELLSAGDTVYFLMSGGGTLNNVSAVHWLSITKSGSLKQVSVNSNQKITIPTSEVRFEGTNARGTVNTGVVYFPTTAKTKGPCLDFTSLSSSANGTAVKMLCSGKLSVNTSIAIAAGATIGITKNSSALTGFPTSPDELLITESDAGTGQYYSAHWTGDISKDDVIRIQTSVVPTSHALNNLHISLQEQEIQVSVSNTLPQFSESDVVFKANGNTGQVVATGVAIPFTVSTDTASAWDGDEYTIPSDGVYSIVTGLFYTTTANRASELYINGVRYARIGESMSSTIHRGFFVDSFTAGQVISIRELLSGGTLFSGAASTENHYLRITKVGKPNVTDINVKPFVEIPVMQTQTDLMFKAGVTSTTTDLNSFSRTKSTGSTNGIYSLGTTGIHALKKATINVSLVSWASSATVTEAYVYLNGTQVSSDLSRSNVGAGLYTNASVEIEVDVGDFITFLTGTTSTTYLNISATAMPDTVVSTIDSFNSDTTSFIHKTTAVTSIDPVGTFSTYSYATSTNTKTVCPTAPSQSLTSMNSDGFLIYTRAYNAASTCGNPARVEIQIGKNLKGTELALYKSAAKTTSGNLDKTNPSSTNEQGMSYRGYDETTGIMYLDSGSTTSTANTTNTFLFSDGTVQTSGYVVINASKNPSFIADNQGSAVRKIGVSKPVKISYKFGGTGTLTAPTICAATPCIEYSDKANVVAAPTRAAAGVYQLVVANGTFAPSIPVDLTCQSFAGSAVKIDCDFYNNGNQTLTTNSSGGLTIGISTTTPAGVATDTFVSVTVEAE